MYLVYDTETTGLPQFSESARSPLQARVCQLACILLDENYEEAASFSSLIKPDGWQMQDGAFQAHGISQELCERQGISISAALTVFNAFDELAHTHVCHNTRFDTFLLSVEQIVTLGKAPVPPKPSFCTMLAMTPICKLPGKFGKYKWPKLTEAHEHVFGETFSDAHDALADVRACAKIFRWLRTKPLLDSEAAQCCKDLAH